MTNSHLMLLRAVEEMALAQAEGSPGGASPFGSSLMFMVIIFAVMYMFLIRPNQRRERERRDMLAGLSKGDRVITQGGIYGTIVGLTEKTVVLRVSDDPILKLEFVRAAVSQVANKGEEKDED